MAAPGAGLPAGEPGQPAPDRGGGWRAVTATERGAAHRAADGSGDDTTLALPLAPAAPAPERGASAPFLGSQAAGTVRGGAADREGER